MSSRTLLVLVTVAVCACGSEQEPVGAGTGGAGTGGASGAGGSAARGGNAGSGGAAGDALTFERMLAGAIGVEDGLASITRADGFPIQTARGFLFAAKDEGQGALRVAGDFNGWQPAPMQHDAGLYWLELIIAAPDGQKYKLVTDADEYFADPLARRYGYDAFGEHSWVRQSAPHLERFWQVGGSGLAPRTVRIWVPGGSVARHLYVHDGQNLFAPDAPFGGWQLASQLGAETLAIGIDNAGADRMYEYTPTTDDIGSGPVGGGGESYAAFVDGVVRPLVEARYGSAPRVGVMGSSLGGLTALDIADRYPERYQFVASLSGTLGWGKIGAQNPTIIDRYALAGKRSAVVYVDSGGGPGTGCVDSDQDGVDDDAQGDADNYCETAQFRDVLTGLGYAADQDLHYHYEPDAPHNEAAWAARVYRPVQIFEALP